MWFNMELLDPFGIQHQSRPLGKWAESHAVHSDGAGRDWTWSRTTCKKKSPFTNVMIDYDNVQSIYADLHYNIVFWLIKLQDE